jgi:hypothetical protein
MNADSRVNGTTPDQIEADIERQRDELAATVSELQARFDVKARAQVKAAQIRDRATTDSGKPRPELAAAAVTVVGLLIGGAVIWRRRTR